MIFFLLKILSPKQIPVKKDEWSARVRFYHWLLCKLMNSYKHSAVSDTIHFGKIQIIHNVRDYWYEQELQRFKIDTSQHMENEIMPAKLSQKYHRSNVFDWTETTLVFCDGKSICIKRNKNIFVESDIPGELRCSNNSDFIVRADFVSKTEEINEQKKSNVHSQKITAKDQRRTAVKYQGFEENEIF